MRQCCVQACTSYYSSCKIYVIQGSVRILFSQNLFCEYYKYIKRDKGNEERNESFITESACIDCKLSISFLQRDKKMYALYIYKETILLRYILVILFPYKYIEHTSFYIVMILFLYNHELFYLKFKICYITLLAII